MREIIFRGKRVDNGEWVEGVPTWDESDAIPKLLMVSNVEKWPFGNAYVDPETVGQFIGIHDKDGKKIFEGDIIKRTIHCSYRNDGMAYDVLFQVPGIKDLYGNKIEKDDANNSVDLWETGFEVIGNIHDNPELLT